MNSNIVGLQTVETGTDESEFDRSINYEDAELDMSIELAAEAAEEAEPLTKQQELELAARKRLADIQAIIAARRNGEVPEYFHQKTDEAIEKTNADKTAVLGELKAAQYDVDLVETQSYAAKLKILSNDTKQEYSVPVKMDMFVKLMTKTLSSVTDLSTSICSKQTCGARHWLHWICAV